MNAFETAVSDRVLSELDKRGIRQRHLLKLCEQVEMSISQPDISKIYSRKKALNLYQLTSISKALGVSADLFLVGDEKGRGDFCDPHDSTGLLDSGHEFLCYKGSFHFYYLSTAMGEEKILHGIMDIQEAEDFFSLSLSLDTGESNRQGEKIIKNYCGRVLVSSALGAAYFILKSEAIGEVCMVCLRHRNYSVKDMECRIGLALTMRAGEVKEPVIHRCLLVREPLNSALLKKLRPWLCMVGSDIRVEKGKLERIIGELQEKFPEYIEEIEHIEGMAVKKEYVEFNVDVLRKQLSMDRGDFVGFLSELYGAADVSGNYGISQADDIRMYEWISHLPGS